MKPKQVEGSVTGAASAGCMCEPPRWDQVIAEVHQCLEAMRLEETKRRAGKLHGMSEEQRAMLDRLTRSLMRRVVKRIEETLKEPGGISREGSEVVRGMFAARDGRGIVRPGRRASVES